MAYDPKAAFRTHSNYLRAFDTVLESHYLPAAGPLAMRRTHEVLEALARGVWGSSMFTRLQQRGADLDMAPLKAILRNAWGTELLLASSGELAPDELIGLANNWGVVQAYYVCYHAVQALAVALGQPRPQSHPKTQQLYRTFWLTPSVRLPPWSLGWSSSGCTNPPPGRSVTSTIHQWKTCDYDTCWDLVALALRTTREDTLEEQIKGERRRRQSADRKQWRDKEKQRLARGLRPREEPRFRLPQLPVAVKRKIDKRLRPATFIDYLYRLRVRSNYEDATMFTEGPDSPHESRAVHLNLRRLTSSTLLVHELYIRRLVGSRRLGSLVDQWLKSSAVEAPNLGLHARRDILLGSQ
jgi:hypothetical protein